VQLCNVPIWCCLSIKSLSIVQVASPKLYGNSGLFLIRVLILSVICPGWARALLIASSSKVLNCDKISRIRASSCLLKRSWRSTQSWTCVPALMTCPVPKIWSL
jgi:hypothetical protein